MNSAGLAQEKISKFVSRFYTVDGEPIRLTPSQIEIFESIFYKKHPYNLVIAFTRFGKTLTTALSVLTRCLFVPEKWAIVAPTEKQARIMMNYIIEHLFDNEFILSKLQTGEGESLEKLRRERSKRRITLKVFGKNDYSEIYILSAYSTQEDPLKGLLGFGASNIVLDESALIDDKVYVGILRMLGDSPNPFLIELGNPLKRNHFYEAFQNPKYHKIVVNYKKGLEEGRITQEQVELMRNKPFFDVLYECKFPQEYGIIVNQENQLIFKNYNPSDCDMFAIGTDLAISERAEADYSAIVVCGRLKYEPRIVVFETLYGHWSMNEMLTRVKSLYDFYRKYGIISVGVEDVAYQRSFGEELERRYLMSPVYIKRTTDKRSRFLMLNPYFVNRQIEFNGNKEKFSDLIEQLVDFEKVEHDDLADAFEMAVSLLKDFMLKVPLPKKELPEEKALLQYALSQIDRSSNEETYDY